MMNEANQISRQTTLFGYIGEDAGVSRFSAQINKLFKQNSVDAMMIPMNIRADDLYFTVTNMKKSHVNGAVIATEYVSEVVDMLDSASGIVKRSGMCDIIYKEGEALRGDIFSVRVLNEHLKDMAVSKIALIGVSHYAKAFSFLACGFEVDYFNDNLEELMSFTQEVELSNADINRIAKDINVDLSSYDAVIDFSTLDNLSMIDTLPNILIDMKHNKQFSALKVRANELGKVYTSYDDMIDKLTQKAYREIVKNIK
jgi:shikimate 5-dehydrogenase